MSVATELTRIQSAKDALKTSIRNKGVSVSDDALISEYPALVDSIEAGGGGDTAMKDNIQGTLTAYTIPNGVTSIRSYALAYLHSLESITIPNSVTTIGGNAFQWCTRLKSVTIPDSVTEIKDYAFSNCSKLKSVTISNGVKRIASYAFGECTNLESVTIPGSVTLISPYAFFSCRNLASVTIPDGLTTIDFGVFQYCDILPSITIPDSVTSIGNDAFNGCLSLKYIKFRGLTPMNIGSYENISEGMPDILVPESAVSDYVAAFPSWENRIFADTHTHDYSVTELRKSDQTGSTPFTQLSDTTLNTSNVSLDNLKRVYIGNNVTTVENETFNDIASASIFIPETNSLETIGANALRNTNVVGDLHLPNVTSIGASAFDHNVTMLSVTIGDRITSIGLLAFNNCNKLKSITCLATTPPTLGVYPFGNTNDCPIYVPAESVDAYKAASGWSAYASRIQAIPSV